MAEERGRVWILEDSPLEAEMARRALAPSQDVTLFSDGSVLLERIATSDLPDLLVLDSQLLGVSGIEVCRIVRDGHSATDLPIVILTVQGAKQDVIEALEAGANDYVTKPYHVAELVARVRTLVSASQLAASQASRNRQLELSAELGLALAESRGLSDFVTRVVSGITSQLGARAVEVWTRGRAPTPPTPGGSIAPPAPSGWRSDELVLVGAPSPAPLPREIIQQTFSEGREKVAGTTVVDVIGSERVHLVAVPLRIQNEVIGVLAVAMRELPSGTTATIAAAANLCALGVARARLEEERTYLLERERAARADAEAANRSKDEFLAMVSHELRTPLNAITGWTSLLISGNLDEARKSRAFETIDRNARAQAQLIDDLLDIGRITSGNLRLVESRFEIATIADMAFESMRITAEMRGVTLVSQFAPTVAKISGDAQRIQQVIWNLLSNAIKFTPKGGTVTLAIEREGAEVAIRVIDSGQGIDSDFLPRVFERFKQADNSSTRSRGGLGLGLAIVRHLVELHHGTIEAASEGLGKGSSFIVRLPVEALGRRGADTTLKHSRDSHAIEAPANLSGLRVLVVDDEPDARELLRTLLESCNIDVTSVGSARDAMSVIREGKIDVLLSDIAMPEEDGLSLIRRIRELPPDAGGSLRAVALTAYARLEDRTRALRAGFNAHVAKPVEPNELLAVLSSLGR